MVNEQCSIFLLVMLHWEATFGGAMTHVSTAVVNPQLVEGLDQNWSFVGEVRGMKAYNQPGLAVCFLKWDDDLENFCRLDHGSGNHRSCLGTGCDLGSRRVSGLPAHR